MKLFALSAVHMFYNKLKHDDLSDIVCVSPDHGGVVRTYEELN